MSDEVPPKFPTPRPGTAVSWDRSVDRMNNGDLLDAIAQFRVAFKRIGIEPPDLMVFESRTKAIRFLHHVTQRDVIYFNLRPEKEPIKVGDEWWHEAEVVGMRFRWPARPVSLPNGGTGWT